MAIATRLRQFLHIVRVLSREWRGAKLEPEVPLMDRFLSPGAQCVHIGASDGRHSLYMARRVQPEGRIFCIEASPYTLGVLAVVRRLLSVQNIVLHHLAIGSMNGDAFLVTPIKHGRHAGRAFAFISDKPVVEAVADCDARFVRFENEPVRVKTLDTFCVEQGLPRLDFLRCDIEGAEILALAGGHETIARDRPVIMLEVHPIFLAERFESSADEVWRLLTDLDYHMFYLSEGELVQAARFFDEPWRDYFCVPRARLAEFDMVSPRG